MALSSKDFTNPWSPGNPTGNIEATDHFAYLVDTIPAENHMYSRSAARAESARPGLGRCRSGQIESMKAQLSTLNEGQIARLLRRAVSARDLQAGEGLESFFRTSVSPSDWADPDASQWPEYSFSAITIDDEVQWNDIWTLSRAADLVSTPSETAPATTGFELSFDYRARGPQPRRARHWSEADKAKADDSNTLSFGPFSVSASDGFDGTDMSRPAPRSSPGAVS